MLSLDYARAYVDELQRIANRPRPMTTTGLRRLLNRIAR